MNEEKTPKVQIEFIIVNEKLLPSILKDLYTFGSLLTLWAVNYYYLGNSLLIKGVVAFFVVIMALARGNKSLKRFNSKSKAIDYIQSL